MTQINTRPVIGNGPSSTMVMTNITIKQRKRMNYDLVIKVLGEVTIENQVVYYRLKIKKHQKLINKEPIYQMVHGIFVMGCIA
jgi:hypothetical protein